MYAKKVIFVLICCLCLSACVCTKHGTDGQILEHQRQVDRAEESIRARDRAIETCLRELEYISTRSENMGGEIEDIIRELDLYQSAVQRLLRAAGYTAGQEQGVDQSPDNTDCYTGSITAD